MDPTVAVPLHFSLEMVAVAATGLVGAWAIVVRRWLSAAGALVLAAAGCAHAAGLIASEDDPLLVGLRLGSLGLVAAGVVGPLTESRALAAGLAALFGGTVWGAVAGGEAAEMSLGAHLVILVGAGLLGWWVWTAVRVSVRLRVLAAFVAVLVVVVVVAGGAVTRVAALDARADQQTDLGERASLVSRRLQGEAADLANRARLLSPEIAPLVERDDPALEGQEVGQTVWAAVAAEGRTTVITSGLELPYRPDEVPLLRTVAEAGGGVVDWGFEVVRGGLAVLGAAAVFRPGGEPVAADVIGVIVIGRTFGAAELTEAAATRRVEVGAVGPDGAVVWGAFGLEGLEIPPLEESEMAEGRADRRLWSAAGLPGPLTLVVSAPEEGVTRAANDLVRAFLVAILAAVALAVVAALWLSARITRPMLDAAREAERVKSHFLASVSHELRTPLTPIRGYAEMLRRGRVPQGGAGAYLDEIGQAAQRMERIVTLLVDVSAMEARRFPLEPEPTSVREVLEELAERWGPGEREISVKAAKSLPKVQADGVVLGRALDELVDNAVKFSPQGVRIELGGRRTPDGVEVYVSDDGPGIGPERIEELTTAFEQAEKGDRRGFGGLGLGLAFVEGVARAHGGRFELRSKPDRGTSCSITLPFAVSVTRMRSTRGSASRKGRASKRDEGAGGALSRS